VSRSRWIAAGATLLGVSLLLLAHLGAASFDGDEVTYAIVARGCAVDGDCVPPRVFGRPFLNKPPLLFWSMAASARVFGANELAGRLPAAMSGLAAVAAVLWVGWRWFGPGTGILAAAVFGSTPGLLLDHGFRAAVTDGPLVLCFLLATVSAVQWRSGASGRVPWATAVAVAACVGFKGLIGPALLLAWLAAANLVELGQRRRTCDPRRDGILALVIGATALVTFAAWLGVLEASGGRQVGARVVGREIVERVLRGVDPAHLQGPTLYARALIEDFGLLLLAALAATVAIVRGLRRPSGPDGPRALALLCWAVGPLAVLHLSVSKLHWYAYPVYPAVALLAAWAILRGLGRLTDPRLRLLGGAALAIVLALRVTGIAHALAQPPQRVPAHLLALSCERQPSPILRIDPAVLFGPRGVRRHNAYYLTGARCAERGPRATDAGRCRYFVTHRRPDPLDGAALAAFPRYLPDEPSLYLVDECGGDLARAFLPLEQDSTPEPSAAAADPTEASR